MPDRTAITAMLRKLKRSDLERLMVLYNPRSHPKQSDTTTLRQRLANAALNDLDLSSAIAETVDIVEAGRS